MRNPLWFFRPTTLWLMAMSLACAACSNQSGGMMLGTVTGHVTLDGNPVTGVDVLFVSANGEGASATVDDEGKFTVRSQYGKGLPWGHYTVVIVPPPPADPLLAASGKASDTPVRKPNVEIPKKYLDAKRSGLSATIQEGNNEVPVLLESK